MDSLEAAYVKRAEASIQMLAAGIPSTDRAAKAFVEIARQMLIAPNMESAIGMLQRSSNELVAKAVAHGLGDSVWQGADAAKLAASYVASIAQHSLLDQIAKYARVLPKDQLTPVLVASGFVGNSVTEGLPKPVRRLSLSRGDEEPIKSTAMVVLTKELATATGQEGMRLFEQELSFAVSRASNAAVVTALTNSSTETIAAGTDPLASLRAGLRAASSSMGYVVAASSGDAAWLSTSESNSGGMGVRGGTFSPGVEIVAVDGLEAMIIVPASRIALTDFGLELRAAGHATVDMRDTPTSPPQLTSLWQTNSVAVLGERQFLIGGDAEMVVVE